MEIEQGIPLPSLRVHKGRGKHLSKYPFGEMSVGDSVFFPGQENGGPADTASKKLALRLKYTRRFSSKKENGGLRIWRVM